MTYTTVTEYSHTTLEVLKEAKAEVKVAEEDLRRTKEALAERIREAHDLMGMPQTRIAEALGITKQRVNEIIHGRYGDYSL